jgi:nucleoside-diphosphate-sugar epimerase
VAHKEKSTDLFFSWVAGYIGRFLALHIHENDLASEVRLVDKHLPELAMLAPEFKEACSRDRFMQADASKERGYPQFQTATTDCWLFP